MSNLVIKNCKTTAQRTENSPTPLSSAEDYNKKVKSDIKITGLAASLDWFTQICARQVASSPGLLEPPSRQPLANGSVDDVHQRPERST